MMGGKKRPISSRTWRLAGEPVRPSALSPAEERIFAEEFSVYLEINQPDPESYFGVPASVVRSRESAARASLSFFYQRFGEKYRREDIAGGLAAAAALPVRFAERFAEPLSVLPAAACWMLDCLRDRGLLEETASLPPADPALRIPKARDLAHDWETVARLTGVLLNRKTESRQTAARILDLLGKEAAASLRAAFRDALLDYFDRFLEVRTRVRPTASDAQTPMAMSRIPAAGDLFDRRPRPGALLASTDRYPDIYFLLKAPTLAGASPERIQEAFHNRRMTELLSGYTVGDPYAVCAAQVLLEREDDLLIHLNMLTEAVALFAARSLPWGAGEAAAAPRPYAPVRPDYGMRFRLDEPEEEAASRTDWNRVEGVGEKQRLSEAQLFYLATGVLPPRDRGASGDLAAWFVRQGIPEARAGELAQTAAAASCMGSARRSAVSDTAAGGEDEARSRADAERIAELTRQLKSARAALHDAELSARRFQERLLREERNALRDRMELSGLRDTLFRMKAGESAEERVREAGIEFPWQGKRRILVFGGHDTWSKAIRPLLPGVRFFDRDALPDLNAIKSADVVWIQANALSHKFYYRIIDTARREEIPVRYFGFASARKCAEQLVEQELADS